MTFSFPLRTALLAAALAAAALLPANAVRADDTKPFLHPLFTDNMVLQRGIADPVWGWTTPGQSVSISFHGKTEQAVAGADGRWTAKFGPFPAGGPYTLSVKGPQTVTLSNIMLGDVWICSGQSNMEFGIGNGINAPAEIAAANYPNIRLFTVQKSIASTPHELTNGSWQPCTPQTVSSGGWNGFSAVGYFFGRDLQQVIPVPIGLIHTSWGGTPAQAWTSAEALATMPDFQPEVARIREAARLEKAGASVDLIKQQWYAKHDPGSAAGTWADPAFDVSLWKTMALPQLFQDAGDPEVAAVNGIVWFRRTFDLPAGDAGKDAVLHLLADDNDTTWVNGTRVGATEGYIQPRAYKIAAGLLKPTGNVIAVRVLDTGGKGGIYGDAAGLNLNVPGGTPLSLSGPWSYKLGAVLPTSDPYPQAGGTNPNISTVLYNGMVSPLIPFGVKGAIWYQGESNSGNGRQYQTLLPTMIKDWRRRFGVGDFPFMIVQLANFQTLQTQPEESGWAELREAQLLTSQTLPKTGLAVAIDIGDANDIHPKNKQEVGRRLALSAEAIAYGLPVEYSGPQFTGMKAEGTGLRLTFSHLGGGLMAKGGDKLMGFAVAGPDHKYVWADARIDGGTVVVFAPTVPTPVAVRYAWATNPICNLINKAGLPASPFRTDMPVPSPTPVLPANAGPNIALGKPYVCSDPNTHAFGIGGLTDGFWDADNVHCFATNDADTFPKTVTIDLGKQANGKPMNVGLVLLGVPSFGSTKTIEVSLSADGEKFTKIGQSVFAQRQESKLLLSFSRPMPAQFVRLTYPDHYAETAGYPNTFAFTTECQVYAPTK